MAIMVHPGLFVGSTADTYKFAGSVLHAARDPWFERAKISFKWKHDEEYPILVNENVIRTDYNEMALNMVDADDARYFPDDMINAGLEFITERMSEGDAALCHCNAGLSRSPSLAMLWLWEHGFLDDEYKYAVPQFKNLYPNWSPGNGIWNYLKQRCEGEKNVYSERD